eukprot:6162-Heterococcus_DN1.PRE.6
MTAVVETAAESAVPVAATAVLAVLAGSLYLLFGPPLLLKHKRTRAHAELCAKVKQERAERQHECLKLHGTEPDAGDAEILKKTAVELCKAMRSGELKCEAVMLAFIRRSRSVGLLQLNCVTEELYDEAWNTAKGLDETGALLSSNASELPLLGLPVSIKDCLDQSGALSTCGLACRAALRHDKDGLLVQLMRTGGAIPFVRSNVPQLLMMSETDNRVFGRTDNPWKLSRTPGGSSGGEGAMVASLSSPLGLGFCGIVGFKPTPEVPSVSALVDADLVKSS